ncbi:MAG: flagellar basal body P-ring protein FlgI [Deltaproteobacteria bacterium]|nr:flagellar basal body P-ring protein FlgI [Deltaproteobacteria bacterium]
MRLGDSIDGSARPRTYQRSTGVSDASSRAFTVSSIGNAKSLRGGSLLMTPLKGADGAVYAMAQGNLVVGGLGAESGESKVIVNIPSAGRIPNGATVERQVPDSFGGKGPIVLNLRQADFTTAERMVEAINKALGGDAAQALDGSSIRPCPNEAATRGKVNGLTPSRPRPNQRPSPRTSASRHPTNDVCGRASAA